MTLNDLLKRCPNEEDKDKMFLYISELDGQEGWQM